MTSSIGTSSRGRNVLRAIVVSQFFSSASEFLAIGALTVWVASGSLNPDKPELAPIAVGSIIGSAAIVRLVAAPVAGAFADRLPALPSMVRADAARAIVALSVATTFFAGIQRSPPAAMACLCVLVAVQAYCTLQFTASRAVSIRLNLADDELAGMSSKLIFASTFAAVAATSVGAVLVFSIGVAWTVVVSAVLAGISAYFVYLSRHAGATSTPTAVGSAQNLSFVASIREGLKLATRDRVVLILIAGMAIYGISLGLNNFALPLFALNDLGLQRELYGFLESMFALGGLVGAIAAKHIIRRAGEQACFSTGLLLLGLIYVGYSINRSSPVAFVLMVTAGIVFAVVLVAQGPMILKAAPSGYTGRFWAILSPVQSTFSLLSTLAVSGTAAVLTGKDVEYSAYAASIFIGAIMLCVGGIALLVGTRLSMRRTNVSDRADTRRR
ncbi:MFS transporter [Arthrobacter rhombi]|uniref:MFS transporter n=1 Tax=Arthrobacter rhombi TaxID=71253 RepID=UPI003FCF7213